MSQHTDDLRKAWEQAEAKAHKLQAQKDAAMDKAREVRDRLAPKMREANQAAADAQKAYLDAMAAEALLDRPDGEAVANSLGLKLPE